MGEGNAPYRPRYVLPDYDLFMKQGSKFLMLDPPEDIWDAVSNLLILYRFVPSVIDGPVYIGHIDRLLEPFVKDEEEARHAIKIFLTNVDRTISDSFCHADIGPYDTKAGRIILELSAQMQRPVPNMSMIYNEHTPDDFACKAIETGLITAKPSFVNDKMYAQDWGPDYAWQRARKISWRIFCPERWLPSVSRWTDGIPLFWRTPISLKILSWQTKG